MIRHYDLFAGIGGFSLALDTIFHEQKNEHIFCEWEPFPTAILKKHWPDGTYYGDIADLVADTERQRLEGSERSIIQGNSPGLAGDFTIVTGGFPCQPFSHAGRRQGTADNRYKWPDMFAVIQNVRPDWVIAENVLGLVTWNDGMVLETVCADLESEGYEVQPIVIPAVAIGAPHRRGRIWIVAHTNRVGERTGSGEVQETNGEVPERNNDAEPGDTDNDTTPNPRQQLREQGSSEGVEANTAIGTTRTETNQREHQYSWSDDWREVAFATCNDRLYDGLSFDMGGVTISGAKYRKEALKAYGNAIVPQVAMEIFKAIKATI